jgi:hypothetical protein
MQFQRETLFDVIEEAQPLFEKHYLELAKNQDRIALNPDWKRYLAMEQAGSLLIYTARKDGKLIAYAAFFSSPHPHYMDLQLVSNDLLYLHPEHRTGRTGVRLIHFCEVQIGALYDRQTCLTWHAKERTPLAAMLPRLAYSVQDIVFSKLLDK